MDTCKNWIYQNQEKLKLIIFCGAIVAAVNCFARADYNLVIYLYIYLIFDNCSSNKALLESEKLCSWFFLMFSIILDVFWTLYWRGKWSGVAADFERNIHFLVLLGSWIGIGIKGFLIFAIGLVEWSSIKSTLPISLREKLEGNYQQQSDV